MKKHIVMIIFAASAFVTLTLVIILYISKKEQKDMKELLQRLDSLEAKIEKRISSLEEEIYSRLDFSTSKLHDILDYCRTVPQSPVSPRNPVEDSTPFNQKYAKINGNMKLIRENTILCDCHTLFSFRDEDITRNTYIQVSHPFPIKGNQRM
jgi:hypothetical protein